MCSRLVSSRLLAWPLRQSRILQGVRCVCFRQLVDAAMRISGLTRKQNTRRCPLATYSQAHAASSWNRLRQEACSIWKKQSRRSPWLSSNRDPTQALPITKYGPRSFCAFRLHGIGSWTRAAVIAATGSTNERVTAAYEGSVDRPGFLAWIPILEFHSGACFITDNTAFYGCATAWSSVRLRAQRVAYSPRESSRRSP